MSSEVIDNKENDEEQPLREKPLLKTKNRSILDKFKYITTQISVEPVLLGFIISAMISKLAMQDLNLEKACVVKLRYGEEICRLLIKRKSNLTEYEREVQKIVSYIESWKSVSQTVVLAILLMFMGAWSDRTGDRKICILLPIIGDSLVCISNIVSTICFYEIPVEVTMFLEAFLSAITGAWNTFFLGVFSYISDITTTESRTFRVGLVYTVFTIGIPIGMALGGILLDCFGYIGIFTMSSAFYLITLVYGFFRLKNNTKPDFNETDKITAVTVSALITLQKDTVSVVTRRRQGDLRLKIILNLLVVAFIYGQSHGKDLVIYLFVRYRLSWDAVRYSTYSIYSVITHSFAALFSISVFSKWWGFDDSTLCLISVVSQFVGSIYTSFVHTDFQMFLVPIVEILNATTFTSLRSMASKLVTSEESGKINSLFSLVEMLASLVFDPIYTSLYAATVKNFTGAVHLLSAAIAVPAVGVVLWFFVRHRQDLKRNQQQLHEHRLVCLSSEKSEI
ncbi:lysosomal proton-coupled steroid conjugate and bile acid symporter SLC46A3-like [Choristoneura fumiferana]|uniref:lysosomal proton-coupled steroid conjugate and bile acid symporter SLC46A3-like n=1 Tax=Choristoneura fumiferana TaxID=7141 RepID=UPI003D159C9E